MYISASAPDAPPLSDTTIGCFIRLFFWMASCIMRAIWSDAPPAPAATTISTGLVGSQARAGGLARGRHENKAAQAPSALMWVDICRVLRRLRSLIGRLIPTKSRGRKGHGVATGGPARIQQ